jgi:hypothetical protein
LDGPQMPNLIQLIQGTQNNPMARLPDRRLRRREFADLDRQGHTGPDGLTAIRAASFLQRERPLVCGGFRRSRPTSGHLRRIQPGPSCPQRREGFERCALLITDRVGLASIGKKLARFNKLRAAYRSYVPLPETRSFTPIHQQESPGGTARSACAASAITTRLQATARANGLSAARSRSKQRRKSSGYARLEYGCNCNAVSLRIHIRALRRLSTSCDGALDGCARECVRRRCDSARRVITGCWLGPPSRACRAADETRAV